MIDRDRANRERNAGFPQADPMPSSSKEIDRSLLIDGLGKGLRVIEQFSDDHPRLTGTGHAGKCRQGGHAHGCCCDHRARRPGATS